MFPAMGSGMGGLTGLLSAIRQKRAQQLQALIAASQGRPAPGLTAQPAEQQTRQREGLASVLGNNLAQQVQQSPWWQQTMNQQPGANMPLTNPKSGKALGSLFNPQGSPMQVPIGSGSAGAGGGGGGGIGGAMGGGAAAAAGGGAAAGSALAGAGDVAPAALQAAGTLASSAGSAVGSGASSLIGLLAALA